MHKSSMEDAATMPQAVRFNHMGSFRKFSRHSAHPNFAIGIASDHESSARGELDVLDGAPEVAEERPWFAGCVRTVEFDDVHVSKFIGEEDGVFLVGEGGGADFLVHGDVFEAMFQLFVPEAEVFVVSGGDDSRSRCVESDGPDALFSWFGRIRMHDAYGFALVFVNEVRRLVSHHHDHVGLVGMGLDARRCSFRVPLPSFVSSHVRSVASIVMHRLCFDGCVYGLSSSFTPLSSHDGGWCDGRGRMELRLGIDGPNGTPFPHEIRIGSCYIRTDIASTTVS